MSTLEEEFESILQIPHPRLSTMAGDSGLPETYHLDGGNNFGIWSYRMKNLLQKDGRFHYCLTPPSKIMGRRRKRQGNK